LLNEDDIKELPAYTLLKMTYSPYLTLAVDSSSTSFSTSFLTSTSVSSSKDLYDPLHAPPSARYGSGGKKANDNIRRPIVLPTEAVTASHDEETGHYSSQMPDMNSCLLGGPSSTKPKPLLKPKTPAAAPVSAVAVAEPIKIQAKQDETIYRVEIQGKNYLRYNDCLYDEVTKIRAGKLADFKLGSSAPPLTLEQVPDFPNYYQCGESEAESGGEGRTIYIIINGEIAQAVGTYENGDIALWS
jgi:hypothetical protein